MQDTIERVIDPAPFHPALVVCLPLKDASALIFRYNSALAQQSGATAGPAGKSLFDGESEDEMSHSAFPEAGRHQATAFAVWLRLLIGQGTGSGTVYFVPEIEIQGG